VQKHNQHVCILAALLTLSTGTFPVILALAEVSVCLGQSTKAIPRPYVHHKVPFGGKDYVFKHAFEIVRTEVVFVSHEVEQCAEIGRVGGHQPKEQREQAGDRKQRRH
jgi:hypothetical protein